MAHVEKLPKIKCDLVGLHELDPDGDVVLVFNSKNRIVSGPLELDLVNAEDWNAIEEARIQAFEDIMNIAPAKATKEDNSPGSPIPGMEESDSNSEESSAHNPIYELGTADIEVRVSSRHLSLASPYFKTLFSSKFKEGAGLHNHGFAKIPMTDDHIDGIMLILRSLHYQHDIPNISPSLMLQIAWTANKFDLASPIKYWSREWLKKVESHIPTQWNPEVITWLGIVSMLKLEDKRAEMLNLAWDHITDTTSCDELPIQGTVGRFTHLISRLSIDKQYRCVRRNQNKSSQLGIPATFCSD